MGPVLNFAPVPSSLHRVCVCTGHSVGSIKLGHAYRMPAPQVSCLWKERGSRKSPAQAAPRTCHHGMDPVVLVPGETPIPISGSSGAPIKLLNTLREVSGCVIRPIRSLISDQALRAQQPLTFQARATNRPNLHTGSLSCDSLPRFPGSGILALAPCEFQFSVSNSGHCVPFQFTTQQAAVPHPIVSGRLSSCHHLWLRRWA